MFEFAESKAPGASMILPVNVPKSGLVPCKGTDELLWESLVGYHSQDYGKCGGPRNVWVYHQ